MYNHDVGGVKCLIIFSCGIWGMPPHFVGSSPLPM